MSFGSILYMTCLPLDTRRRFNVYTTSIRCCRRPDGLITIETNIEVCTCKKCECILKYLKVEIILEDLKFWQYVPSLKKNSKCLYISRSKERDLSGKLMLLSWLLRFTIVSPALNLMREISVTWTLNSVRNQSNKF